MALFFCDLTALVKRGLRAITAFLTLPIYFGKYPNDVPAGGVIFFPCANNMLACGLAGIVAVKQAPSKDQALDLTPLSEWTTKITENPIEKFIGNQNQIPVQYLGGKDTCGAMFDWVKSLKSGIAFYQLFVQPAHRKTLKEGLERFSQLIASEEERIKEHLGLLDAESVDAITEITEMLKDITWCLKAELLENLDKVNELMATSSAPTAMAGVKLFREMNAVLNSIDRLEVRGRDSAGISLMFLFADKEMAVLERLLEQTPDSKENRSLLEAFNNRAEGEILLNNSIGIRHTFEGEKRKHTAITMTYKVAAEIGSLGDNVRYLRNQIQTDSILHLISHCPFDSYTISSHTRWASVGAINEANCHPVDNRTIENCTTRPPLIHACLNGDIDNYLTLKSDLENQGANISEKITTDTKIIPLQVEKFIQEGETVLEAFRRAVNSFDGSHAISMHTDLAPGKLFLAQRGSGQAIFVGLADAHYMPTSEVYGFIEETSRYIKMDGEKIFNGKSGPVQGQIFILDQHSEGGLKGIQAIRYDGSPINLSESDVNSTALTSRDIDRQGYPHYFLKEISESPMSVERTLINRWKIEEGTGRHRVMLDETVVPEKLRKALRGDDDIPAIRRIFFVGQGTAGVAALACADIMNYFINDPLVHVTALKASELSGFKLGQESDSSMSDTLVVAISQSGTTTDTNRTVDMVKERGAHTLAIVNRRDSDITFKTDGVLYTSSGRDIEMSVASTKAFYSQIVAGALLGLFFADVKGRRGPEFLAMELKHLLDIPSHMKTVLSIKAAIESSARRLATTKVYWAAVGSGPNKASADEIRIKLSELCYKTISSDYVEDKKHIDLSSEPLIIVCAAGTRDTVVGDIIKDTAIFKAHKATPVVIADEGEDRFAPYAEDVFHVPSVPSHLAPILNTLVGHLWGYYAALSINEGSKILYKFRDTIERTLDEHLAKGLDVFEVILEKRFREKIIAFYNDFRIKKSQIKLPRPIAQASDLILLLKYLSGRLPASDFELDFQKKGTARNMLDTLFEFIANSINAMARPVDAIKHQAKTVTVGTSRITEKVEGILFDALKSRGVGLSQLTNTNVVVLKNLQAVVSEIKGAILYEIGHLDVLGEPTENSTINIIEKTGVLAEIPSRVENDQRLKGTKRIIIRQGNVYIGKGRKDDRSILVIPIISSSPEKPNLIENLLLLNIDFKQKVPLASKAKALGGKHEHIKNIVQENNVVWDDRHLELVPMDELFGRSAEKIGEYIVSKLS